MTFKQWINEPAYPLPFVINEEGYQEPAVNNVGVSRLEYYVCSIASNKMDTLYLAIHRLARIWESQTGDRLSDEELKEIYGT